MRGSEAKAMLGCSGWEQGCEGLIGIIADIAIDEGLGERQKPRVKVTLKLSRIGFAMEFDGLHSLDTRRS